MLARMQRNWITHVSLVRTQNGTATQNRNAAVAYKTNYMFIIQPSDFTQASENMFSQNLYYKCRQQIYSQYLETTEYTSVGKYIHYGKSIPWTTTQQEKETKDWYVKQFGWIPKELC